MYTQLYNSIVHMIVELLIQALNTFFLNSRTLVLKDSNIQVKIISFFDDGLSLTSIVGTVKEMGCGFNIMTTAANPIYTILKVMFKLVII